MKRKLWQKQKSKKWTVNRLVDRYGNSCYLCGASLSKKEITIDHYVARSKGGGDELDNLRIACLKCNRAKGTMSHEEFLLLQEIDNGAN